MSKITNNIYARKDGRYEGRLYQEGTHKYRSVYAKTYEEVSLKLQGIIESGSTSTRTRRLLFNDIVNKWLDFRSDIKLTSLSSYKCKIHTHILPYFRRKDFPSLTAADLEKFKAQKISEGLSEKYVADMVVIIKSASKYAAQMYSYPDPFSMVSLPKVHKAQPRLLSSEEQEVFVRACMKGGLPGLGCFLSLFLGLRLGEVCGLKWENIDLPAALLRVRYNVQRVPLGNRKSKICVLTPKTDTSIRDIPLPRAIVNILKKYKQNGDVFVVSGTSEPLEPRALSYRFKIILQKAGLPSIKFHSLRHSFATNFIRHTGDVRSLSELLGHSSVNITLQIYVHSSMEQKLACMEKLAALL